MNLNRKSVQVSMWIQDSYKQGTAEEKNNIFVQKIQRDGPQKIAEIAFDKYAHYILEIVLDIGPLGHKQWIFEAMCKQRNEVWCQKYCVKILVKCIEVQYNPSIEGL